MGHGIGTNSSSTEGSSSSTEGSRLACAALRLPARSPSALLLSALTVLAAACGGGESAEAPEQPPTGVDAVVAREDTIRVRIRSVGSLEADQRVEMSAEASGRVSEIPFTEGQRVRRGEVLLLLDRQKLRAERGAARAAVNRAEREAGNLETQVERNRGLLEAGAISRQAFDDLRTQYESAQSRLEEARAQLSLAETRLADATIRAPFAGRVGARGVDVGTYVAAGDELFVVVDNDPLEIQFTVPERYIGQLREGSPVTLAVASFPDRSFGGEVSFVSPVVDPQNRTVTLKASIPNPDEALRAGQFANVGLQLETRPNAVVVPEQAIVPSGGERFVFLVQGGSAVRRSVELGERSGGRVEVTSGVGAGDTVVVAGQQRLGPDSPVAPRMRDATILEERSGTRAGADSAGGAAGADSARRRAGPDSARGPAAAEGGASRGTGGA